MRENNKLINRFLSGNKSFVVMKFSLVAAVLIGLVVFTVFNMLPVHAEEECDTSIQGSVDTCNSECQGRGYSSGVCTYSCTGINIGPNYCITCTGNCCCSPECSTNEDCNDGEVCTDDACVNGLCEYTNNDYQEEQDCGTGECAGKKTRTCSGGEFGPWSDCSSEGDPCGECDPGPDCVLDEFSYTIDILLSGGMYCDKDGCCQDECIYDHFCLDNDYSDGSISYGCSAECDGYGKECPDYCSGDILYDGFCNLWPDDCTCDYKPEYCNDLDEWVDTGNKKWVELDQCNLKEQKEQEYRDYTCVENTGAECDYTVTDTKWIDTGNTKYKDDGTSCNDENLCTENDVCVSGTCTGKSKDCSDLNDQCQEGACNPSDGQCYPDYNNYPLSTYCEADDDKCTLDHCDGYGLCVNYGYDDNTPPIITKKMFGKYLGECPPKEEGDECYVSDNGENGVEVAVEDPIVNDCAIDQVSCYYELWWGGNVIDSGNFGEEGKDIIFTEDSEHVLKIECEDALDNSVTDEELFLVDSTPPIPIKDVDDPKAKWDGKDAYFYDIADLCWNGIECWKVTKETKITMSCEDPEPHPVGVKELCYELELDGKDATEQYCGKYGGEIKEGLCCISYCEPYEFYFTEDSEHELEFYCVDKLDNMSPRDIEKFKVYGGKFEIKLNDKWNLISVPFVLFSDDPKDVFEKIKDDVLLVLVYDPEHKECGEDWCVYNFKTDAGNLEHIKPGWGYWVLTNKTTTLTVVGSLMHEGETLPSRSLVHGWNLIGYYGTKSKTGTDLTLYDGPHGEGKQAFCALHSLVNEYNDPKWDALIGYWNGFIGLDPYCDYLDPGAGYWVGMNIADPDYRYADGCSGNECSS